MKGELEPEKGRRRRQIASATRLIIATGLSIPDRILLTPPEPDIEGLDILSEPYKRELGFDYNGDYTDI